VKVALLEGCYRITRTNRSLKHAM